MRRMLLPLLMIVCVLTLTAPSLTTKAKAAPGQSQTATTIAIPATQAWTDTGIDLTVGSSVSIVASGTIYIAGSDPGKTPDGDPSCTADSSFVAPGLHCWSLIGNIANGTPFEVGSSTGFSAAVAGRLYLGVNDNVFGDNSGSWTATITVSTQNYTYDPGNYAGKSGFVSVGNYNEPNDKQHRNYCGPGASQVLISAWTSNVPDIETLAKQEKTNPAHGTLMVNMVTPINSAIGQSYYSIHSASSQGDFSNMIGQDILDNQHPLITGIITIFGNNSLNGWTVVAKHIITIYGFDFTSPSAGTIYYYETSGTVGGTTATGRNSIDYTTFWSLVQQNNIQLA